MLKKRIIPCLDIQNGRTVKGINFVGIRDAGNPVELAKKYARDGADELVFLDITATIEKRDTIKTSGKKKSRRHNIHYPLKSRKNKKLIKRSKKNKARKNKKKISRKR